MGTLQKKQLFFMNSRHLPERQMTQPASLLERAIAIALHAHQGQTDKAGQPYILHPLRLMLQMNDLNAQITAVLHDVVEDSDYTLQDLAAAGFEPQVLAALDCLTKRAGETRLDAAHRAAAHPLARRVKLADNADNMDLSRLPNPGPEDHARLSQYLQVRDILQAASPDALDQ